ncbi:hypothetical protein H9P43_008522 [Blastocladiella emersonii ATCC 22665]|nr:hypothetical protein H9P43_008522 [Blastocladiella emersonii ATCC 22665]
MGSSDEKSASRRARRERSRSRSPAADRHRSGSKRERRDRSRSRDRGSDRRSSRKHRDDDDDRRSSKRRHRSRSRSPAAKASSKRRRDRSRSPPVAAAPVVPPVAKFGDPVSEFLIGDDTGRAQDDTPFVWEKKKKRDRKLGRAEEEDRVDPSQLRSEIDLLQRRREEREEERRLREEERVQAQREADRAQFGDWESREDEFQLQQARLRAQIRVKEGRPLPVDLLALSLQVLADPQLLADRDIHIDSREPYRLLERLDAADLRSVARDIEMYLWLEQDRDNQRFWQCLRRVCAHAGERAAAASSGATDRRVSPAVYAEIQTLLHNKSMDQLVALEKSIRGKLDAAHAEPIDVEYWEAMLDSVQVWQAKAQLRDYHCRLLDIQAQFYADRRQARREQQLEAEEEKAAAAAAAQTDADEALGGGKGDLTVEQLERAEPALSAAEQAEQAEHAAREVADADAAKEYSWAYKYRPRKPKYVNRVNTGYEWNKYNKTHYDADNPPPKVVQGYKFNVFYPDLLDRSKAPTFKILPKPDGSKDTVILKFIAGPPYEDIAFEIINKEWEYSHRRGFRCVFDRGVLQLHFQFKRFFYRK